MIVRRNDLLDHPEVRRLNISAEQLDVILKLVAARSEEIPPGEFYEVWEAEQ